MRRSPMSDPIAAIRILLASPEHIRAESSGEVTNPEMLDPLTGKPIPGGLCCERIFGPTRDWSCACGTFRRAKRLAGHTCPHCGVLLAPRSVRRERMGHIELAAPVVH